MVSKYCLLGSMTSSKGALLMEGLHEFAWRRSQPQTMNTKYQALTLLPQRRKRQCMDDLENQYKQHRVVLLETPPAVATPTHGSLNSGKPTQKSLCVASVMLECTGHIPSCMR